MELTIEQALQQGVAAHNEGKLQDAERLYLAVLQSQPLHPDANHNLGVLAVSMNKTDTALSLFKTALEANPKIEQFWLSYIDALIKEKQFDNAKQVLEQAKKQGVARDKVDAIEAQITTTTQVNEPKLVVQKKSLTLSEKRKKLAEQKKQKKAKKQNLKAISPSETEIKSLLEHYQNGRYDSAEKLAKSITQQFPLHQFGWTVLGALLKQTGRINESLFAKYQVVELVPLDAEAHYSLGTTLQELSRLEEAEASYTQAVALKPDFVNAHYNLGNTRLKLGRLKAAQESYMQAIVLKPDYAEAYSNLGNTLKKAGKLEEAKASYRQSIVLAPDYAEAHSNLGITLQELGILDDAEASYKQAIALKPDFAIAHSNLGNTLQELGRLNEAEASYTQAIALKPDFVEAHSNLGNTLQGLGRLDESEASFRRAISLKPDFADAHSNLGVTLKKLGRLDEAEASYARAIVLKPDSKNAAQNMVKLPVGQLDLKTLASCGKALLVQSESIKNQASYYFFHANLLNHKGLMEQSFNEFCKGNKLRWEEVREQFTTHEMAYTGHLNRIKQWTPNVPEIVESRLTKLFLMGPSRSGKSSLEHLLRRSPQVKPLYEGISHIELSKAVVNGKVPCEKLYEKLFFQSEDKVLHQGYKVVTTTSPDNIFYSDYLIDMLPNTYFLIIKRDLRDIAPEIFINEYAKEHFYSYNPNGISIYLSVYNKICEELALKVPDRCITINFEDFINSPEDTIERIGALVCRNFEVGHLDKYVKNFTSESLFRDHFSGINISSKL